MTIRAEAGVGSFNQQLGSVSAAANQGAWSTSFFGNGDQLRRLSDQQCSRATKRRRRNPLYRARLHGVLQRFRRQSAARISRRQDGQSVRRNQRTRHRPHRHRHPLQLWQPAGRQRHRRVHQDVVERRRTHRRWRRARQDAAGGLLRQLSTEDFNHYVDTRSNVVDHSQTEHQKPGVRITLFDPDRHRLLRCDLSFKSARTPGRASRSTSMTCRKRRWPPIGNRRSGSSRPPISPMAGESSTPARPRATTLDPNAPGFFVEQQISPLNSSEVEHALHVGIEHRFNDVFSVFGRAASAFRTPNIDERIGASPIFDPPLPSPCPVVST